MSHSRSLVAVVVGSVAFAVGALGCAPATPRAAATPSVTSLAVAGPPSPVAARAAASAHPDRDPDPDAAPASPSLLYPYNLPQYRDDLAAALGFGPVRPPRARPRAERAPAFEPLGYSRLAMPKTATGYLHGYSNDERERLHRQARFLEPMVHDRLPFRRRRNLLEVGAGVGAQTEILLRHFPEIHVTGVEINEAQIAEARRYLAGVPWAHGGTGAVAGAAGTEADRYEILKMDATKLEFAPESFDSAFLCWVLEHVGDPARVLSEIRRVLQPGSPVVCNEVLNATFFIDPYSPDTVRYWMAFNDHQLSVGGDPFVGAKLGNLLQSVGFRDVQTEVKTFHLDNRAPASARSSSRTGAICFFQGLRRSSRRTKSRWRSSTG